MENYITDKLKQSVIYKVLLEKSDISCESKEISTVNDAVKYACVRLKLVLKIMPGYTLHDEAHSFKMLSIMEKLIPQTTLEQLDIPELMLLILSAFFHDLGMAPSEKDINIWQGKFDREAATPEELEQNKQFENFKKSNYEKNQKIIYLTKAGKIDEATKYEKEILFEYIRINHSKIIRKILATEYNSEIKYKNTDLKDSLASICESHCKPVANLSGLPILPAGNETYICTPFIAVLLRLSDIIDFDADRTPQAIYNLIDINNPISLQEWKKHLAIENFTITPDQIIYKATCNTPQIEHTIRHFCNDIDTELNECRGILSNLKDTIRPLKDLEKYNIKLPLNVNRDHIKADIDINTGKPFYRYHDIKFTLNKDNIMTLLMGSSLYGNKDDVAIRELLQNSIDTCLLRQASYNGSNIGYRPKIAIRINTSNHELSIVDNGMGMNPDDIQKYYSNIGTSYYKSPDFFALQAKNKIKFTPISRFGIGILSCFMVADKIKLDTRKIKDIYNVESPIYVTIENQDNIFYIQDSKREEPGTTTILKLKPDTRWYHTHKDNFYRSIQNILKYPPFEVELDYNGEILCYDNHKILDTEPRIFFNMPTWGELEGQKVFDIILRSKEHGINGRANIILLEKDRLPVNEITFPSSRVKINDEESILSASLSYERNAILHKKNIVEVNLAGEPSIKEQHYHTTMSMGTLSIHGIEYANEVFSQNSSYLRWPFPTLLILNYGEPKDLDLNSARNEIIRNEKWREFEQNLFQLICTEIYHATSIDYWNALYSSLQNLPFRGLYDPNFYRALDKSNIIIQENHITKNGETLA